MGVTGPRSFILPISAETELAAWRNGVRAGNQGWTNEGPRAFGRAAYPGSKASTL